MQRPSLPELRALLGGAAPPPAADHTPDRLDRFHLLLGPQLPVSSLTTPKRTAPHPSGRLDLAASTLAHRADCTVARERYVQGLYNYDLSASSSAPPDSSASSGVSSMRVRAPGSDVKFSTSNPRSSSADAPPPRPQTPLAAPVERTATPTGATALDAEAMQREADSTAEYNALLRVLLDKLRPPPGVQAPPADLVASSVARLALLQPAEMAAMHREASVLSDYGSVLRLIMKRLELLVGGEGGSGRRASEKAPGTPLARPSLPASRAGSAVVPTPGLPRHGTPSASTGPGSTRKPAASGARPGPSAAAALDARATPKRATAASQQQRASDKLASPSAARAGLWAGVLGTGARAGNQHSQKGDTGTTVTPRPSSGGDGRGRNLERGGRSSANRLGFVGEDSATGVAVTDAESSDLHASGAFERTAAKSDAVGAPAATADTDVLVNALATSAEGAQPAAASEISSSERSWRRSLAVDAMAAWAARPKLFKATVRYSFSGSSVSGGLSVEKGEVVLCKKLSEEWCHCFRDREQGYVPSSYLALERNVSPSPNRSQKASPRRLNDTSPLRHAAGMGSHGRAAPSGEEVDVHARASQFAELLRGAQATARGLSPAALTRGAGSPAAPVTPTLGSPLGGGLKPESGGDVDAATPASRKSTDAEAAAGALRRSSTVSALSAALTDAWLTGRVRGGDSPQYAADVLASTTDLWLGAEGVDGGGEQPGGIVHLHPHQQQQQLVWTASGSVGRSRRLPRGQGGGASASVNAAVGLMMAGPRGGGSINLEGLRRAVGEDENQGEWGSSDTTGGADFSAEPGDSRDLQGDRGGGAAGSDISRFGGGGSLGNSEALSFADGLGVFEGAGCGRGDVGDASQPAANVGTAAAGQVPGGVIAGALGGGGDGGRLLGGDSASGSSPAAVDAAAAAVGQSSRSSASFVDSGSGSRPLASDSIGASPQRSGEDSLGTGDSSGPEVRSPRNDVFCISATSADAATGRNSTAPVALGPLAAASAGESDPAALSALNKGDGVSSSDGGRAQQPVAIGHTRIGVESGLSTPETSRDSAVFVSGGESGGDYGAPSGSSRVDQSQGGSLDANPAEPITARVLAAQARVKMLALTGPELCALLIPKAVCVARLAVAVRLAIRFRRLMKAAVVAVLRKWVISSRLRRQWTKVLAVAVPRVMLRLRRVDAVRARVFAVGFLYRSVASFRAAALRATATVTAAPKAAAPKAAAASAPTGPKLRPIHWEALTEAGIKGTIWDRGTGDRGDGAPVASTPKAADLLLPALVTKFAEKAPAPEKPRAPGGAAAADTTAGQQLKCQLAIKDELVMGVSIIVEKTVGKKVAGKNALVEIRDALLSLDRDALGGGLDRVQIMLELEPILTNKEKGPEKSAEVRAKEFDKAVAPVRAYTGDVALLAAPDRFIKDVVLCVPGFFARLKVLELLYLLPDALALCHRRLDIIQSATVEIKTSPRLATLLLDVVLPLGNTLNTHARKAVAAGFHMSSLSKLLTTKAASGETFLRFIVEGLSEASPDLLEVSSDFPVLRKNSKGSEIALVAITDDCMRLQQRVRQFGAVLQDADASVAKRMAASLESAAEQVGALHAKLGETTKQFKELCKWLGEDPNTTQPEDLFGWVAGFVGSVADEAKIVHEKAERAAKLEARKKKEAEQRASPPAGGGRGPKSARKSVVVRSPGPVRGIVAADLVSQSQLLRKTRKPSVASPPSDSPTGRRSVRMIFNAKGGVSLAASPAASEAPGTSPPGLPGLRRSVSLRESGNSEGGSPAPPPTARSPPLRTARASVAGTAIALSLAASAADALKTHRQARGGLAQMAASAGLIHGEPAPDGSSSSPPSPAEGATSPPGLSLALTPALLRSQSGTGAAATVRQRSGSREDGGERPPPRRPSVFEARLDEITGGAAGADDDADLREFERSVLQQRPPLPPTAVAVPPPPQPATAMLLQPPPPSANRPQRAPPLTRHGSTRIVSIPEDASAELSGDDRSVSEASAPAARRPEAAALVGRAPAAARGTISAVPSASAPAHSSSAPPPPASAAATAAPLNAAGADQQVLLARLARLASSAPAPPLPLPPPHVASHPPAAAPPHPPGSAALLPQPRGEVPGPAAAPPPLPPRSQPPALPPAMRPAYAAGTDAQAAAVAASQAAVLSDSATAAAAFDAGGAPGLQALLASLSAASAASTAAQRPSVAPGQTPQGAAPTGAGARPNSAALSSAALSYLTR